MESLRLIVRDKIEETMNECYPEIETDMAEFTCIIADAVFEALGITEQEQDIYGRADIVLENIIKNRSLKNGKTTN